MSRARGLQFIIILMILLVIGVGSFLGVLVYLNQPPVGSSNKDIFFMVQQGENLSEIAGRLEKDEVIQSALFLILLGKVMGTESSFQAGPYKIKPGSTTLEVHKMLATGQRSRVKITIPEGWTVGKIADLLDGKGLVNRKDFLDAARSETLLRELEVPGTSVEGYLFPDTYFFPEVYAAEAIIRTMVGNFRNILKSIQPDLDSWDKKELHNTVILASIVEREYRIAEEAPLIASVFKNRMRYNIGLESCASLEYIITEIQGKPHPKYITLEDKTLDSANNTYKWYGLPPGPISNPGKVALDATFHSADTDYFYFVLKDPEMGRHYFSKNLTEHNQAKIQYLKGVSDQN